MKTQILEIIRDMTEKLDNGTGVDVEGAELHHELCNTEQYFEDKDDAKKFMGEHAFDCIRLVKEWEEVHMGETHTNFACPCCVANMFYYCIGEYVLGNSTRLEGRWDAQLDQKDLNIIREEISTIDADNLLLMASETATFIRHQEHEGPHAQHAA